MTRREEAVLLWLIALNALFLLIAPIGGATIVQALVAAFSGQ